MRIMDSLMAIPSILLAIALVSLNGPSIWSVMIAITIPEIPRVVRLVRSVVLSGKLSVDSHIDLKKRYYAHDPFVCEMALAWSVKSSEMEARSRVGRWGAFPTTHRDS